MKAKTAPRSRSTPARSRKVSSKRSPAKVVALKPLKPISLAMKEIVVPVDFSEHSRTALRYALAFAGKFKARLVLVHIVEQIVYSGDWLYAPPPTTGFPEQSTSDIILKLREFAGAAGKKIVPVVRLGRPWQQIVAVAKDRKSDLIISATHGHTGLKHALLGSVAEKIVRHAHCPVLTVRAD